MYSKAKFKVHYIEVITFGKFHIHFKNTDTHYVCIVPNTNANGILIGRIWVSLHGNCNIVNYKTNEEAIFKFHPPPSLFSKEPIDRVTCIIRDSSNFARYVIEGRYTEKAERFNVLNPKLVTSMEQLNELNLGPAEIIWKRKAISLVLKTHFFEKILFN